MYKNYLVTAWRNMVNHTLYTAINIFGLSIGLMSCILILLYVRQETGFDTWVKDSHRVVRVHSAYSSPNNQPFETVRSVGSLVPTIRNYAKNEVASGTRLIHYDMIFQHNGEGTEELISIVDDSFFDVFDLPFLYGDKVSSFAKPMDLIITEEMALKYFGKTDVVGETMMICCFGQETFRAASITGVIKDFPDKTHLDFDFIFHLQPSLFEGSGVLETWNNHNVYSYFMLNEGISSDLFQERLDYWLNNESHFAKNLKNSNVQSSQKKVTDRVNYRVMPLHDLHLRAKEHAGNMGDMSVMGDQKMIHSFILVAVIVLLIACINFINLSTAKASKRACEVAVRKITGASRTQLIIQFLSESIFYSIISLFLSLVAVEVILPFYNELLHQDLELIILEDPQLLLSLIALSVIVGLLSGLYPALYLSSLLPGNILTSSKSGESKGSVKLRAGLVVFQFVISSTLIISTAVIYGQTSYSTQIDTGYRSDNKLIFHSGNGDRALNQVRNKLLSLPEVESVVHSSETPSQDHHNNSYFKLIAGEKGKSDGSTQTTLQNGALLNQHRMGYDFFESYEITPIAGRLFNRNRGNDEIIREEGKISYASAIINESASAKLGFDHPEDAIGSVLSGHDNGELNLTVIGVIPDIYFRSIKFGVRPSIYTLDQARFKMTTVSYNTGDVAQLIRDIERIWRETIPEAPVNIHYLNEQIRAQYNTEIATSRLFFIFSILAICIACLGLYGLSAFVVERRKNEIGLRKVMGARVKDIIILLIRQFSRPVILANVISWPIASYYMLNWLEGYSYRISDMWLIPICLAVSTLTLMIAWLTITINANGIARKSPIESLRYE